MDTHIDFVGLSGLVVALVALLVAVYGILDVRKQVKYLLTLERNRLFTKLIHTMVWRFVDRVSDAESFQSSGDMHEFTMLVRLLDPKQTLDSAQEYANTETLALAQDLVTHGLAKWRADVDEHNVSELLKRWQNNKNAATLKKIFGRSSLAEPSKDLIS